MIIEARDDTITLRGIVRTNIWPAIQAAAALLLENHPTGIIIDCSGITRITARGAETFADAFAYIHAKNARIVVAALSPDLLEIGKEVPGVRSQLPIAASVDEARSSLQLEEVTPQRGKARLAGVVPMVGDWRRAVYHADKLAVGENCEVHLVDMIKVPLALPIGSPLPEREGAGQERLQAARQLVRQTGLKCFTHVERVRSVSTGLVEFVGQLKADFAVVSMDQPEREVPSIDEAEALSLLEAAEFEVSLVKGGPNEHAKPPTNLVVPAVGAWEHAVEHACKLLPGQQGAVSVIYIISIPRTEPIDAPRPDDEAAAADSAREAARIGKKYGVRVRAWPERVRDPILGFLRLLDNQAYDLAVVGVRRETAGEYSVARAIGIQLMHEQPCETVVLRASEEPGIV